MKIKETLEQLAYSLQCDGVEEITEIFISKEAYQALLFQYNQHQRMPDMLRSPYSAGIEIMGRLEVKPITELEQLREENKFLEKRLVKLMSAVQARALLFKEQNND